jgi:heat shock protein HslJ
VAEVVPPTAAITGPSSAAVGESGTFSAANSTAGTGAITGYQWQSGDGNNTEVVPDNSFSTIYSVPGVYYPAVMVVDANNLSDGASMSITINAALEGNDWILAGTIPGTTISAQFANGSLTGFGGCNSYNGTYTVPAPGSITIGPISSSQALCSEDIMTQEQGYFSSLQTATAYSISGNTLTLTTSTGPLTFNAAQVTIQPVPAPAQ